MRLRSTHIPAVLLTFAGTVLASFNEPVRLTSGAGSAADPGADLIGSTLLVAHVDAGALLLRASDGGQALEIAPGVPRGAAPRLAIGDLGRTYVLYLGPGDSPRLHLVEGSAGLFEEPIEIAADLEPDAGHALAFGPRGGLRILHASGPGGSELVLITGGTRHAFAGGSKPALQVDPAGFVHVSYVRDGVVFHRTDRDAEDFSSERALDGAAGVLSMDMAVKDGAVHWLIETSEGIRHAVLEDGAGPRWSAAPVPGSSPALAVTPGGVAFALYLRNGSLLGARTAPGGNDLGPELPLFTPQPSGEIRGHAARADGTGGIHVVFEWAGEIYHQNDVPPPVPLFRAERTEVFQGEAVLFEDLSTGAITTRAWDFGDGTSGDGVRPVHSYDDVGFHAVTLRVSGPGGARSYELPERIRVLAARNIIEMPQVRATLSSPRFTVPILLTSEVPVGGFQLAIEPSPFLSWTGFSYAGTDTERLHAELVRVDLETDSSRSAVVAGVLWDWQEPFDGRTLPPVKRHAILLLDFDILAGATPGDALPLGFVSGFGPQAKGNVLAGIDGSASITPFTIDGAVVLVADDDPVFLRGDANGDARVDISDAIGTLFYLFVGGIASDCPDAADTNDDGLLDISDAVEALLYLFSGGSYPAYPFPREGLDGTADSLSSCVSR